MSPDTALEAENARLRDALATVTAERDLLQTQEDIGPPLTGPSPGAGTRGVVKTAIDLSKSDKRRTWEELLRNTEELAVSVMASSKGPGAGGGK